MSEEWRSILGYEGLYEVSDLGRVRGVARTVCDGRHYKSKIRKPKATLAGHLQLYLFRDRTKVCCQVHRLVLEAFVGPCPAGMQCAHNDGDPANNRRDNLRWDTPKGNNADKIRHGTHQGGERNAAAKLTASEVTKIRSDAGRHSAIARSYGISQTTVWQIKNGLTWKCL